MDLPGCKVYPVTHLVAAIDIRCVAYSIDVLEEGILIEPTVGPARRQGLQRAVPSVDLEYKYRAERQSV